MINFFKNLFSKSNKKNNQSYSDLEYEIDYNNKRKGLESVLGKMHTLVGHAIFPFSIGGAVDMYYFPNHIEGTGFATMELLAPDGSGPLPNRLGTYELVAFTKLAYDTQEDIQTPFSKIERRMCGILTSIGFFSTQAVINPNETCEIPTEEGQIYLVFDQYHPENKEFIIGNRKHHLLLCIEIFQSEMEFSRAFGSRALFALLKEFGHYPYSDLDREPVV